MSDPLLAIDDLELLFQTDGGVVRAVRGVSLTLEPGEIVGLVGESGSGKSATAMAIAGLNTTGPDVRASGSVRLAGRELLGLSERELQPIRGAQVGMIFQDPMTSLNPVRRVGALLAEVLRAHEAIGRRAAQNRAVELLREVGIPEPERRARAFPHELSGGMRQRVMIAMALACEPAVLIADEPTTALDATIQLQVLQLIAELRERRGTTVLLITHDLGVIARLADRVLVMYAGRIVEEGSTRELLTNPRHPYTAGLLQSLPRADQPRGSMLTPIPGQPPSALRVDDGCPFADRCEFVFDRCGDRPALERVGDSTRASACWLAEGAS